jgi:nitrous oxidase accessory protein NosD
MQHGLAIALFGILVSTSANAAKETVHVATVDEFVKAVSRDDVQVVLKPGRYTLGPDPVELASGVKVEGNGTAVLAAHEGTGVLIVLADGASLTGITVDGAGTRPGYVQDCLIHAPRGTENVAIRAVQFLNSPRVCVLAESATGVVVEDCMFRDVYGGVHLLFSKQCRVEGNSILRARHHGIQVWGLWNWEERRSSDIVVRRNLVIDVGRFEGEEKENDRNGGVAIWAAGAEKVRFEDNLVDGATDVGLDMEWCTDGEIVRNVSQRAKNGCISLFYSCVNVRIANNVVVNNWPYGEDTPEGWWSRAGIWLTPVNTDVFEQDSGHKRITITGNVVNCEPGPARRAIWLPQGDLSTVVIRDNVLSGGDVWVADTLQKNPTWNGQTQGKQ